MSDEVYVVIYNSEEDEPSIRGIFSSREKARGFVAKLIAKVPMDFEDDPTEDFWHSTPNWYAWIVIDTYTMDEMNF